MTDDSDGYLALHFIAWTENSIHGFGGVAFDNAFGNGVGPANFAKHAGAGTRCAFLGEWVEFDQAQADAPTIDPLEIVYQGPV